MALVRGLFVLLGAALTLLFLSCTIAAGEVGVNYGTVIKASDLPDPALVAKLLKDNGVTMVRIYDAKEEVVKSLADTGIKVMVMIPNEQIPAAANDPTFAQNWVQSNVAAHLPATQITGVAVGNEVFNLSPGLSSQLVPAMRNVQAALSKLGLANTVKVSTPVAFDALKTSFPVSDGSFRDDLAPVMKQMLEFLQQTGSYLTMNIYPLFAYANDPQHISLDYALGNPNDGVTDEKTALKYYNLLDAQIDAAHHAMEALGFAGVSLYVTESGWPSKGKIKPGKKPALLRRLLDTAGAAGTDPASVANAQAYNNNLVNRVLFGQKGTPYRPDADLNVYIFALFNENNKSQDSDDVENNFGLFDPRTLRNVYDFSFQGTGKPPGLPPPAAESWCVANAAVGDARLQEALDYACGHGADCGALQPGGSCFDPDTTLAHASYAFNSYYQAKNRAAGTCDFSGAASIVYHRPADTCGTKPPMSWCVANAAVGDARLQTALDYACANGADCSAIQPSGSCFQPNTMVAHASYAFNSYYQAKGRARGTCDFSGAGSVVNQQPDNTCGATAATWCVANSAVSDARLQTALDYACANGADCSAIQAGAACFDPNTKVAHASYAFNSYYQRKGRAAGTCNFSGTAVVVNQAPKFGNCVLPSNG